MSCLIWNRYLVTNLTYVVPVMQQHFRNIAQLRVFTQCIPHIVFLGGQEVRIVSDTVLPQNCRAHSHDGVRQSRICQQAQADG